MAQSRSPLAHYKGFVRSCQDTLTSRLFSNRANRADSPLLHTNRLRFRRQVFFFSPAPATLSCQQQGGLYTGHFPVSSILPTFFRRRESFTFHQNSSEPHRLAVVTAIIATSFPVSSFFSPDFPRGFVPRTRKHQVVKEPPADCNRCPTDEKEISRVSGTCNTWNHSAFF